jgi:hypothetical protein
MIIISTKTIKTTILTKTKKKVNLIPNPNHETRKTRTITQQVKTKIQQDFIPKHKQIRFDKKTYPKLMLNKLKVMGNSTSIYTPWAPNIRKFIKKLPIYMWPMFIHMCQCAPMCEL